MNTLKTFKTIIAISLIATIMTSCDTLRIATDTTTHGERVILTSDVNLFEYEDASISIALGEKIAAKDTLMGMLLVYDGSVNRPIFGVGDKMTFTLRDNATVTLTNLYDKEFEAETTTHVTDRPVTSMEYRYVYDPYYDAVYLTPDQVTRFVPEVTVRKTRRSYALYPISKTDLLKIIDKGVAGVTIESDYSDMTTTHTEDWAQLFTDMWNLLRAEVKANLKK